MFTERHLEEGKVILAVQHEGFVSLRWNLKRTLILLEPSQIGDLFSLAFLSEDCNLISDSPFIGALQHHGLINGKFTDEDNRTARLFVFKLTKQAFETLLEVAHISEENKSLAQTYGYEAAVLLTEHVFPYHGRIAAEWQYKSSTPNFH